MSRSIGQNITSLLPPIILGVILGACARHPHGASSHPSTRSVSLPAGHPPIRAPHRKEVPPPGPDAIHWAQPYILLDGQSGQRISQDSLRQRLQAAQAIYVAETHNEPSHHYVQLQILKQTAQLGPVAVGLEMIQRPYQPGLDAYLEDANENILLQAVEWDKRWGYDFRLYRPIFQWAQKSQSPLIALNAQKELTRAVAREGVSKLTPPLKKSLPKLNLRNERHRSRIELVWLQHAHKTSKRQFQNFYAAQVVWDETMAHSISQYFSSTSKPYKMVVLAGVGHIRYGEGIPDRAMRRGIKKSLTILPLTASSAAELVGSGIADILWVFLPKAPQDKTEPQKNKKK